MPGAMHEMSIVSSILAIVDQELANAGATKLLTVVVKHGRLTNIMPEALTFAWEALTRDTPHADSRLTAVEVPLVLRCFACKKEFTPEDNLLIAPCPACGEELGHTLVSGRELFVERLEAE